MNATDETRDSDRAERRLSHWSFGIGTLAILTMFFNPLSALGAVAVIPGVKAIRANAPNRRLAVVGMALGVLATILVIVWLAVGSE